MLWGQQAMKQKQQKHGMWRWPMNDRERLEKRAPCEDKRCKYCGERVSATVAGVHAHKLQCELLPVNHGNFHCILLVKEDDTPEYVMRLHEVNRRLIERTLAAGGSCTGEHGIGVGKKQYLEKQYGAGAVEMMRTLKRALDPQNILNPGKVVDV